MGAPSMTYTVPRTPNTQYEESIIAQSIRPSFERECERSFAASVVEHEPSLSESLSNSPLEPEITEVPTEVPKAPSIKEEETVNDSVGVSSTNVSFSKDSLLRTATGIPLESLRRARDWWLWEIGGMTLSLACMASIIAVLPYMDNRPLSEIKLSIAPNTLISTFITIAKTAMLLPVAEGISQLKWVYFQTRSRPLDELDRFDEASRGPWGSLKFLLRVAVRSRAVLGALGALVIIFALCMEPFAQQIILYETRYVPWLDQPASIPTSYTYDTGMNYSVQDWDADTVMEGAFFNGLFDLGVKLNFNCPTGNCTWPDFSTIAMCSACSDVTATSKRHCGTPSSGTLADELACSTWDYITPSNISLPGGTKITGITRASSDRTLLATVAVNQADTNITECEISWCARTYTDVKVVNGVLTHNTPIDYPMTSSPSNEPSFCGSAAHFSFNIFNASALPPGTKHPFTIACADNKYNQDFLSTMLTFNLGGPTTNAAAAAAADNNTYIAQALLPSTNMTASIKNITDSMTQRIRNGPNSVPIPGIPIHASTFIVVRYPWLSLPAALVLLSALFLALTIRANRRIRAPIWKSSLLPLLFHDVQGWRDHSRLRQESRCDMEAEARAMAARLKRNEDGHRCFAKAG